MAEFHIPTEKINSDEVGHINPVFHYNPAHIMSADKESSRRHSIRGWEAVLGSSVEALALFRISLGFLLVCELLLRFRFLHAFYSDEGCVRLGFNCLVKLWLPSLLF